MPINVARIMVRQARNTGGATLTDSDIEKEYQLIMEKKSALPSAMRARVVEIYRIIRGKNDDQ